MNRLKLDFSLSSNEERKNFLDKYLEEEETFKKKPPTEEELEMMGNYLLWGKDPDGKNVVQRKEIQIQTKNRTWDKKEEESLDALLETPTFNETLIVRPTEARPKISREVFSRKDALKKAPESVKPRLLELFSQIDRIDLTLNFYDLAHEKRKNPPREELLQKFSEEEISSIQTSAQKLTQFKYLKLRHLLVELRREQFTIRDSFSSPILRQTLRPIEPPHGPIVFESDVDVFPIGLFYNKPLQEKLFPKDRFPLPEDFSELELQEISTLYWEKKDQEKTSLFFDFTDIEHVYNLFLTLFELEDEIEKNTSIESTTNLLLKTLFFYIERAELSELQKLILKRKIQKFRNQDIANEVNRLFGKSYTANYISTIFRKKIIKQINEAAAFHERIIGNLFFPENFKVCNMCGRKLLKDQENFVRKSRAKDGFSNRCKDCDREERQKKKKEKSEKGNGEK